MWIQRGEPRIGKTRLLDEFTRNISPNIRYNYINLHPEDSQVHTSFNYYYKISRFDIIFDNVSKWLTLQSNVICFSVQIPYTMMNLIFSKALDFTAMSTQKEREDKLLLRLGKVKYPYFLCVFNEPFNVQFPITTDYNDLNETQKRKLLRKFLLKLIKGSFRELWVNIIDDAEYSDPNSLEVFDVFTKKDIIFFVISIGRKVGTDFPIFFNILRKTLVTLVQLFFYKCKSYIPMIR